MTGPVIVVLILQAHAMISSTLYMFLLFIVSVVPLPVHRLLLTKDDNLSNLKEIIKIHYMPTFGYFCALL